LDNWDQILENLTSATPCDPGVRTILAALEQQLAALDRIGAHIAAAHLDAAIQQLRRDQVRD
jgi:hypothetical protein